MIRLIAYCTDILYRLHIASLHNAPFGLNSVTHCMVLKHRNIGKLVVGIHLEGTVFKINEI